MYMLDKKNSPPNKIQIRRSIKAAGIKLTRNINFEILVLSSSVLISVLELQQWESAKDSRLDPVLGSGRAGPELQHSHYLQEHDVMKD